MEIVKSNGDKRGVAYKTENNISKPIFIEDLNKDVENKDWLSMPQFNEDFDIDKNIINEFDEYDNFFDSLSGWKKEWFMENIQRTNMIDYKENELSYYGVWNKALSNEEIKNHDRRAEALKKYKKDTEKSINCFYKWWTLTYINNFIYYMMMGKKFDSK